LRAVEDRTDRLCDVLSWVRVPQGSRNNAMLRVAGKLRHAGGGRNELRTNLLLANEELCDPPLPTGEVEDLADRVSEYAVSGFLALPRRLILSDTYLALSRAAKVLLVDLGVRYTGDNNGRITAPFVAMREKGWKSSATLARALNELRQAGLIELTAKGGSHRCSTYRLPWALETRSEQRATREDKNDYLQGVQL
jgi:hypothetical protein